MRRVSSDIFQRARIYLDKELIASVDKNENKDSPSVQDEINLLKLKVIELERTVLLQQELIYKLDRTRTKMRKMREKFYQLN